MSYASELLADYAFERDYPFGIPNPCNPIWKTQNGQEIPIYNMTIQHIKNCMRLVGEDNMWYDAFAAELQRRKKICLWGELL